MVLSNTVGRGKLCFQNKAKKISTSSIILFAFRLHIQLILFLPHFFWDALKNSSSNRFEIGEAHHKTL